MSFAIADLGAFRTGDATARAEQARIAATSLIDTGCLLVRPFASLVEDDNERFLDMMEDFFALPDEQLQRYTRPELGYQVGATLEGTEKPRCGSDMDCKALIEKLDPAERPLDLHAEFQDPKARFFWRQGERSPNTQYKSLNAANVVPSEFPQWHELMDRWGRQMKESVEGVAEMLAVGLGLPSDAFTSHAKYGAHLLAPTATPLERHGQLDTIFAGFHNDLGFLTIHGRSRYPGLSVWARNSGRRIEVSVPPGCLLVQAGKQLEHVTAGLVLAGYHEVACTKATLRKIEERRQSHPDRPLIRISSTFFWHLDSDYLMDAKTLPVKEPSGGKAVERRRISAYQPMTVGDQMTAELKHIALAA